MNIDSTNASSTSLHSDTILCPKPHIGAGVFDIVNAETDCLKNPQVCHVVGQSLVRPEVIRVTTRAGLQEKSLGLRTRGDALLKQAEAFGNEERAEQIRTQIFKGVGGAVEQYVALRGNTTAIEAQFKKWVFKGYWKEGQRGLDPATCNMLVSGEYIWHEYAENTLNDWAAPAIQYCRALEFEVRRRLYSHSPTSFRLTGAGWTLGVLKYLYHQRTATKGDAAHNWALLREILARSGCKPGAFEDMLERLVNEHVVDHRNHLAHGEPIQQSITEALRDVIIGDSGTPGILGWITRNVDPA